MGLSHCQGGGIRVRDLFVPKDWQVRSESAFCCGLRTVPMGASRSLSAFSVPRSEPWGHSGAPKAKSDSSRRTITLPTFVVAALRTAIGLDGGPDDLVFPSRKASPRSPSRAQDHLRW